MQLDYRGRTRPMRVLNLGLFRTGTTSLRQALNQLGHCNVYHMDYVFTQKPADSAFWLRAYDAKYRGIGQPLTREDWDTVLGDCDGVSDFPCAAFSEELIAAYPEAKVILTVRDFTETWAEATRGTVWHVHRQSPFASDKVLGWPIFEPLLPNLFRMGKRMFYDVFEGDFLTHAPRIYEEHNERIKRIVPADRLLVFNVKQGWAPLCSFLGSEVTPAIKDQGFPHVNDRQAFIDKVMAKQAVMRAKLRTLGAGAFVGVICLVLLIWWVFVCWS